ncbi:MAG: cytochrome c oxidase subunit 3 [Spirochaetia bacterium]|nr:cytochrome c oxidase subunit 3 [Spirochaetia bacterium]
MSEAVAKLEDWREVPKARIAMWLLIGGELVIFGAIIVSYLMARIRYPEWAEQTAFTIPAAGFFNTFVLLTSSWTAVMAHGAAHKKEVKKALMFLGVTLLGGVIFLCVKAFEYHHDIEMGLTMTSPKLIAEGKYIESVFWTYYYTMTGFHASHVIVGMTIIAIVMMQIRKGENLHRVEYAGMYWHFVDLVWIFLFPLLYIAK